MTKSKRDLDKFLLKHKRQPEKDYTHTAITNYPINIGGSYTITGSNYNTFLDLYYNSVLRDKNPCHLTESHTDFSPILIDLDFRFPLDTSDRKYNIDFIENFISIYIDLVKDILDVNNISIHVFVHEKTTFKVDAEKGFVKDGIHIIIPNIVTTPKVQYVLRYKMLQNENIKYMMDSIGAINDLNDIIDIRVIEKNNWQMYGSCKPDHEAYKTTHVYDFTQKKYKEIPLDTFTDKQLLHLFSIRNKSSKDITPIKEESLEDFDKLFNSLPDQHKMKKRKRTVVRKKKKSPTKAKDTVCNTESFNKIKALVGILDKKRADNYQSWIEIGWCLHNIDETLLSVWEEFSEHSSKYKKGECKNEWDYMDNDGLGMGTLYMWAKEDNYGKYKEITSNDLRKYLLKGLSGTNTDIAYLMYQMFKDDFVYAKKKVWYQFRNHKWVKVDEGISIKKKISNEVLNEYLRLSTSYSHSAMKLDDADPQKELALETIKKISQIMLKLKNTNFKKNVLEECNELFYIEKFEETLNNNVNLIGFENGVYDLENDLFRKGIPEDYISYTTGIDYEVYDEDDVLIEEVRNFVQQVLPIKDVREYVLTLFSSFLDGKITGEKFHIWTGSGGNGKSKIIELFQHSFGDYCCQLPSALITQKRARAEACNPVLVRTKGKRFACLQEPEGNDKINVGLMKELTGGDKIIARGLHQDPIEFKPQFKMVLTCNDLPEVSTSSNDDGTWRRIRAVHFPSKFLENPDPKNPFEFPIDESLSQKLPEWGPAFVYILFQYYKDYKKYGIYEPDSVKKHTREYKESSDQFSQFFNERIVTTDTENSGLSIHIDDAYYQFQEWYKLSFGNVRPPSRKELQTNLAKKYGTLGSSTVIFKNIYWADGDENNDTI
jgi:P4 family phage/plasmid primase-like protien